MVRSGARCLRRTKDADAVHVRVGTQNSNALTEVRAQRINESLANAAIVFITQESLAQEEWTRIECMIQSEFEQIIQETHAVEKAAQEAFNLAERAAPRSEVAANGSRR